MILLAILIAEEIMQIAVFRYFSLKKSSREFFFIKIIFSHHHRWRYYKRADAWSRLVVKFDLKNKGN